MPDLEKLRARIDSLDRDLVDLLIERLRLAVAVGRAKQASGLSFYDPERERVVLDRIVSLGAGRYPAGKLRSVYREIISAARAEQAAETILVHGARGSLSHYAAFLRFGGSSAFELSARDEDLFARLEDESCAYAVVSLEGHSLEASLDRLDLFLHAPVHIFGVISVHPRIGLYAPPELESVPTIHATPAVLAQASRWIAQRGSRHPLHVSPTLAEAVAEARRGGGGVLAHPIVEFLEGWQPLEEGLEDLPEARRRFFILSRREAAATGRDRTSLLVVLANRTGSLHEVTTILARHQINLAWIEPKATHLGGWDHLFLIEVDGHRNDAALVAALGELRSTVSVIRVLGSYPEGSA